jgi:hypothetical protein
MSEYDAALGAFQRAFEEEASPQSGNQHDAQPNQAVAPETTPVDQESQPDLPASKSIDLSGLPEEAQIYLRAREREMQADYTRKTQEAAALRAEAEQAMQFIQALNSDPQFALQAYQTLGQQLAQLGLLQSDEEVTYDEYGQPVEPDPYAAKIAELEAWRDKMQEEWLTANLSAQLDRQIATIQSQHPDWGEQDLQAVIDLGFATNGDLLAAAEQYQAIQDHILSRYLSSKASVTTPAPLPNSSGNPVPQKPKTDEELRAAAMEIVRANLG